MAEQVLTPVPGYPDAKKEAKSIIRKGLFIILVMFGGVGGWAAFAPLHGAVVASGQVKVESSRKTVQHLDGGIVGEILVKEGDLVKQGQTLIILASTQIDAQYNMLKDQLDAEQAHAARLTAEKNWQTSITFPEELRKRSKEPKIADILRNETHVFDTRRDTLNSEIDLMRGQIGEVKGEIEALTSQIKAADRTIGYLQDELKVNEKLAEKGFVAAPHLLELKRSISSEDDKQGENAANIARAKQKINDLNLRIASLKNDYSKQASDDLQKSQDQIFDLQERFRIPEDQAQRQKITAPVTGRIVDLKVHTIGGVIAPREPLMDIVPEQRDMIVESRVQVQDIDDLHLDMQAEVRLTAYKQRTTPLVQGELVYIGADSLVDETTHQPYYPVHVKVNAASLKEAGDDIVLYPGMPAEVYILTHSRTALEYLLDPITSTLRKSFRES